jgi:hypothetical protein
LYVIQKHYNLNYLSPLELNSKYRLPWGSYFLQISVPHVSIVKFSLIKFKVSFNRLNIEKLCMTYKYASYTRLSVIVLHPLIVSPNFRAIVITCICVLASLRVHSLYLCMQTSIISLFVHIIRLFYRQVRFIFKGLVGVLS